MYGYYVIIISDLCFVIEWYFPGANVLNVPISKVHALCLGERLRISKRLQWQITNNKKPDTGAYNVSPI